MLSEPLPIDAGAEASWTTGLLRFQGTPLSEVLERVNRHTRRKLVLTDGSLAGMPIYAILKVGDIDAIRAIVRERSGADPAAADRAIAILEPS